MTTQIFEELTDYPSLEADESAQQQWVSYAAHRAMQGP